MNKQRILLNVFYHFKIIEGLKYLRPSLRLL